ncbi:F-box/WD repeat-containing protein 4 [Anticarsia gemmatalis]|uniref:F-box/WD repeat-containing protein 4 n=1 Tax=Anticarsia gemmatalis TaxID=129554 RepID=UPI003F764455
MATDNILLLPVDILIVIFRKLEMTEIRCIMSTCKTFRNIVKGDHKIWRTFSRDTLVLMDAPETRLAALSWYNRYRISRNWLHGCFKTKSLLHHYTNYMPWLTYHNSEILYLSVGSELVCYKTDNKGLPSCSKSLWRLDVPKVVRQDVRTNDISRFVIKNNVVVCGNRDGCVAAYRITDTRKKPKLECHIKDCHDEGHVEVTAVEVVDVRDQLSIITGSSDSPDLLLCTLRSGRSSASGSYNAVNVPLQDCSGTKSMALNAMSDKLAIGPNGNSKPVLFDVTTGKYLMTSPTTVNHRQAVRDIRWHNDNTILHVTHSGFMELMDIRTNQEVYRSRDPFQSSLYCVKSDGMNALVAGSAEYSRCVLFDARKAGNYVQMYFTQRNTSPVYCLDFDSTKLISAVDRGLALLNFNVDSGSQEHKDYSGHVFH